ncbi:MAG: ATP-binding cassette domain-containing protein, partial [Anaerolineae bacterium]|nr:ATP-binding cassette domain-containing protein [Anaerolineae bacterium]
MPPLIEVRGVTHAYAAGGDRHAPALRGIDLIIEPGEFVALVGPNGSGKSTLAHHLNGLLLPTTGDVRVNGLSTADPRHLWSVRQQVGMVFQNPDNQIVAGTVEEDVAFGPENLALPPTEIRHRVEWALEAVGLTHRATRPPHTLSGGQKQLLAIAGALASQPACLVLDEPTAMLDPSGRQRVLATLHRLN